MLKSMTAFGRARGFSSAEDKDIRVEIRSVNSRYLDYNIKLPRSYSFMEEKIKSYLSERGVVRGKIDIFVGVDILRQTGFEVLIDNEAASSYISALSSLKKNFELSGDITVMDVAQYHDIFSVRHSEDDGQEEWEDVKSVLAAAVDEFVDRRITEGKNLEADIALKVNNIRDIVDHIEVLSRDDIDSYRLRLDERIRRILEDNTVQIDEQRILTEVAIYADKACIDEEIVRLRSHFSAMADILSGTEPAGRKLDFLMQELNREINTIGSKVGNADIAHLVVDAKTELEKIREQIQNIE